MRYHRLTDLDRECVKQMLYTGTLSHTAIAEKIGCSVSTVQQVAVRAGIRRGRGPLSTAHPSYKGDSRA